jgi:hypothetical protein
MTTYAKLKAALLTEGIAVETASDGKRPAGRIIRLSKEGKPLRESVRPALSDSADQLLELFAAQAVCKFVLVS